MHDSKWNAENIVDFHLTNKLQKSSFNKKKHLLQVHLGSSATIGQTERQVYIYKPVPLNVMNI